MTASRLPQGAAMTPPRPVRAVDVLFTSIIIVAAASPFASPTVAGILDPSSYRSIWNWSVLPPLSMIELLMAAGAGLWLMRAALRQHASSVLDRPLGICLLVILVLHAAAHLRGGLDLDYQALDLSRIAFAVFGYIAVTRLRPQSAVSHRLLVVVCAELIVVAAGLVITFGVIGTTNFGTNTGRVALLITEDALLLSIPAVILWGRFVDGVSSTHQTIITSLFLMAIVVIQLLSLRRGALLFLGISLLVRALAAKKRIRPLFLVAAATTLMLSLILGVTAPMADDVRFAAATSTLQSDDASAQQRRAEIENYRLNTPHLLDVLLGRGLGASWKAVVPAPVDIASFGGGETASRRVGWHVYGLDWLYKFGLIGCVAFAAVAVRVGLIAQRVRRRSDTRRQASIASLAVLAPVLTLFLFTNPRIAFMCGVILGLLSRHITEPRPRGSRELPRWISACAPR